MLFVVGVTFLMIGIAVAAGAAMIFQERIGPPSVQRLVNNAVLSVILAMFVGTGLMILFLFIVEFKDQTFGILEAALAIVIAAAGIFAVRAIASRHRGRHDHPHMASGHPA